MPHPSLLLSWRDLLRRAAAVPGPLSSAHCLSRERMFFSPTPHLKHAAQPVMLSYIHETPLKLASVRTEAALITCVFNSMRVSAFLTHTDCWRSAFLKKSKQEADSFYLSEGPLHPALHLMCHVGTCGCLSALTRAISCPVTSAVNQQTFLCMGSSAEWMLFTISHFGFIFNDSSVLCLLPPS